MNISAQIGSGFSGHEESLFLFGLAYYTHERDIVKKVAMSDGAGYNVTKKEALYVGH